MDRMRFYLGIVTKRKLDDLHYGSQSYCAQPCPGHRCDRRAEAQSDDLTHGPAGRPAASGTGAEAASRAPRARDQGHACARRASSHKSLPRARILSPEYVCVQIAVYSIQIVTVVRTNCHRRAQWIAVGRKKRGARTFRHIRTCSHVTCFLRFLLRRSAPALE